MNLNEIKKNLYKAIPKAEALLISVSKSGLTYRYNPDLHINPIPQLFFLVPLEEIGDATWEHRMDAKLLIRYIIQDELSNNS